MHTAETFTAATETDPGDPVLWYSLGMEETRGDLSAAERAYDMALFIDQREPECWIFKSTVAEACGDVVAVSRALDNADSVRSSSRPSSWSPKKGRTKSCTF